jgi:hypothetical protein
MSKQSLLHIINGCAYAAVGFIITGKEALNYNEDHAFNILSPIVGTTVAYCYGYGLSVIAHPLMPAAVAAGIYFGTGQMKKEKEKVKQMT